MARLFGAMKACAAAFSEQTAQIFVSGGHGGLVVYDGKGGPMVKEGGPMDRLFFLRNDGKLIGDAGLDLVYGYINIRTGNLKGDVVITSKKKKDTCACFKFDRLKDRNAFEIRGGVVELGLPRDTVLISGDIAKSEMVWESGDYTGREQTLPYVAYHPRVKVHRALLEWFGVSDLHAIGAETGWCKLAPNSMNIKHCDRKGMAFRTQQHLGHLRVLLGKDR